MSRQLFATVAEPPQDDGLISDDDEEFLEGAHGSTV
jgi:hypothetical protein